MDDTHLDLPPQELFRLAKVDHYVGRAEELCRMARYSPARQALERALKLDGSNAAAISLCQEVDRRVLHLTNRNNGSAGEEGTSNRRPRGGLVLVVDQDEQMLLSVVESLNRNGFEPVGAGTYEEALQVLALIRPDAIVSEINFEGGPQGFELFHDVKSRAGSNGLPFIFLAATVDRELLIAGKRFGVDDFLLKPVDGEVVSASVAHCLGRLRVHS